MPLNTKAESRLGRTSFHGVLHKVFLDARKNTHLASKAEGMAEFLLEERVKARNKANTAFTKLSRMANEGELSPSLFKDLSDAGSGLHEQDTLLKEAEAKLKAAKKKSAARSVSFQEAKTNCEQSGCPQFHGARDEIPEPSKEEEAAQEAAKEKQERSRYEEAQARAAEKARNDDAAKEKKSKWKANWERSKGEYQQDQASKKRRRDEYEKENPRNSWYKGSKPFMEDAPPTEPQSKKPRPTPQMTSPPVQPIARPPNYQAWISTAEEAFKDYTTLTSFPSPPASECSRPTCNSETRALAACACNIRQGLNHLDASELKGFRTLFHPDKFSKCREDLVEGFKEKANAVFVVVNDMYGEKKGMSGPTGKVGK
jgi:hypothetical protein